MEPDAEFIPELRPDIELQRIGAESVAWSPVRRAPVALDPVATVMLDVIDGQASIGELVQDVAEVVGASIDVARTQVLRVIADLDAGGLLVSSGAEPPGPPLSPFANPASSCMEASSCTGRVEVVNLSIGGHELRVASQSGAVARQLRKVLSSHLVAEQAPLGFLVRSSRRRPRHLAVVDRCGFTVANVRGRRQAVATLASHLSGFAAPRDGTVRLRVRALVDDQGTAALCTWPLLFLPELDEVELAARGQRVLDRLAVDVDSETGDIVNLDDVAGALLASTSIAPGHQVASSRALPVRRVLVARPAGSLLPSPAQVAAELAAEALSGERHDVLRACATIAGMAERVVVDPNRAPSLYEALEAWRSKIKAG